MLLELPGSRDVDRRLVVPVIPHERVQAVQVARGLGRDLDRPFVPPGAADGREQQHQAEERSSHLLA